MLNLLFKKIALKINSFLFLPLCSLRLCVYFFIFFFTSMLCGENWIQFQSDEICGDSSTPCLGKNLQITLPDGTKVDCSVGYLDPLDKQITLYGSQGKPAILEGKFPAGGEYRVEAARYTLTRQKDHAIVAADAPLIIYSPAWGEMQSDGKLELLISHERKVRSILVTGDITIKSDYKGRKICQIPGELRINFQEGILTAKAINPSPNYEQQIYFEGEMGGFFANAFIIYYDQKSKQPLKYLLEGNVRLKNIFALQASLMGKLDQHALADRMEYDVAEGKAIFNATGGHRVLFLDQAHKMQLSAGELHVYFDKETHEPVVKGIGDVRLSFGEKEIIKMQTMIDKFKNSNSQKN